jgi:hypothetical protein
MPCMSATAPFTRHLLLVGWLEGHRITSWTHGRPFFSNLHLTARHQPSTVAAARRREGRSCKLGRGCTRLVIQTASTGAGGVPVHERAVSGARTGSAAANCTERCRLTRTFWLKARAGRARYTAPCSVG